MYDWNDLKAFLAVARGGSTLAASKALGVNQTTVARRIEALEAELGLKLFERAQSGSRLTEAAESLVADAERVEEAATALKHRAGQHLRGLTGRIRVTSSESLANAVLTPALPEFGRLYPDVAIDLLITDRRLDLAAGEADVALRGALISVGLADSNLVARKVMDDEFALYCSRDYAARHGTPATMAALNDHILVAGEADLADLPGMAWMRVQAPRARIGSRSSSLTNLLVAVRAGLGIGPLPCILADADEALIQICPPIPDARGATWIVTRPDLKDVPRVRAFIDFMVPHMATARRALVEKARRLRGAAAVNTPG